MLSEFEPVDKDAKAVDSEREVGCDLRPGVGDLAVRARLHREGLLERVVGHGAVGDDLIGDGVSVVQGHPVDLDVISGTQILELAGTAVDENGCIDKDRDLALPLRSVHPKCTQRGINPVDGAFDVVLSCESWRAQYEQE